MTIRMIEKKIETFSFDVSVGQEDIEAGKCRDPNRCMEKLAIHRALVEAVGEGHVGRLRIDGAQIKFNLGGYRWYATTPKRAKRSLIAFDAKKPVAPHRYSVTAIKGTKIERFTAERQQQINEARNARIAAGNEIKKKKTPSLHSRVIGLGAV